MVRVKLEPKLHACLRQCTCHVYKLPLQTDKRTNIAGNGCLVIQESQMALGIGVNQGPTISRLW